MQFFMPKALRTTCLLFDLQTHSFGGEVERSRQDLHRTHWTVSYLLSLTLDGVKSWKSVYIITQYKGSETETHSADMNTDTFSKTQEEVQRLKGNRHKNPWVVFCTIQLCSTPWFNCWLLCAKVLKGQNAGSFSKRNPVESNFNCHSAALYLTSKQDY